MSDQLDDILGRFEPISLEELDERAALLRRTDHKYVVDEQALAELADRLRPGHQALEIDGRRLFRYENVYLDTPDLRCFHDHVDDRAPRFKVRTRHYRDSGKCNFEVKLKSADGETDKRQIGHPPEALERITEDAERLLRDALAEVGLELAGPLEPTLRTSFGRFTLVAREGAERLTCDVDIALERFGGGQRWLRDGLLVLESKSEDGDSPADTALRAMGIERVSLSKYKVGMAMLTGELKDPAERFFE